MWGGVIYVAIGGCLIDRSLVGRTYEVAMFGLCRVAVFMSLLVGVCVYVRFVFSCVLVLYNWVYICDVL